MENWEWEKEEDTYFFVTWENRQRAYNWQMAVSATGDEQSTNLAREQQAAPIVKALFGELLSEEKRVVLVASNWKQILGWEKWDKQLCIKYLSNIKVSGLITL